MSNQLQRQYSHTEMAWFYGRIWLSGMVLATLGGLSAVAGFGGVAGFMLAATAMVYGGVSLLFLLIHTLGSFSKDSDSDLRKKVLILFPIGISLAFLAGYLISISR